MQTEFMKRAKSRRRFAIFLLIVSIVVLIIGIGMAIGQVQYIAQTYKTDEVKLLDVVKNLMFMLMIIFMIQVLVKLYRYNMVKSDFYLSCADALRMSAEMDNETVNRFGNLLATLTSDQKNMLETPESPSLPGLPKA